jgi:transcriptional regulator with XRE-family HTH domain
VSIALLSVYATMKERERRYTRDELLRAARRTRRWRADHRLSQREFSRRAGLSNNAFHGFESGDRQTKPESLDAIARVTGLSVDELIAPDERVFTFNFDERIATLTPYTIEMALEYQIADTATKQQIDDLLNAHRAKRQQGRAEPPAASDASDAPSSREESFRRRDVPPTGTEGRK